MAEGVSPQERDDSACMTKWNSLYGDFKKIKDYHAGTGHNLSYWTMTAEERDEHGLPRNFSNIHFEMINDFLRERPAVNPPLARDFQRPQEEFDISNIEPINLAGSL
jgi:hypothetical protein